MSAWRYNVSFAMGVLLMLHVVHCTVGYWSSTQATMYRSLLGGYMSSARYIPISTVINLPGLNFDTCYVSHGEDKFLPWTRNIWHGKTSHWQGHFCFPRCHGGSAWYLWVNYMKYLRWNTVSVWNHTSLAEWVKPCHCYDWLNMCHGTDKVSAGSQKYRRDPWHEIGW